MLALLSDRVPLSLKVFLTALAILDDLGAVRHHRDLLHLGAVASDAWSCRCGRGGAGCRKQLGVRTLWAYLVPGALLWFLVLKSGVHATIAGVLLAAVIPIAGGTLERLEQALRNWVAFLVLPLFGFANAGVALGAAGLATLGHPVALGSALGLFLGKQVGVFGGAWLTVRAGACRAACRRDLGAGLRHRDSLRHWFHDEPVHRAARLYLRRLS